MQLLSLLSFAAGSAAVLASPHDLSHSSRVAAINAHVHHRSTGLEVRAPTEVDIHARFSGGGVRYSWFKTGLGACGQVNVPGDYIVALNSHQWEGGAHCNKVITIRWGGKQAQAKIMDRCEECPFMALDFTEGLFNHFSDLGAGYLWGGSWDFGYGGPSPEEIAAKQEAERKQREREQREKEERERIAAAAAAAAAKIEAERVQREKEIREAQAKKEAEAAAAKAAAEAEAAAKKKAADDASAAEAAAKKKAEDDAAAAAQAAAKKTEETPTVAAAAAAAAPTSSGSNGDFVGKVNGAMVGLGNFLAAAAKA